MKTATHSAVDTNVPVAANGRNVPQAGPACVLACLDELDALRRGKNGRKILLDAGGLILAEYRRHLRPSGQPGAGDAFFKWLWRNQENPIHCRKVEITPAGEGRFAELPADPEFAGFDPSDRKFAAAALAHGDGAEILNATDSDWGKYEGALARRGVRVRQLCPGSRTMKAVRTAMRESPPPRRPRRGSG